MTTIEWTDVTWNPTTGCDKVSPGCDHCYAMTMAKRLKGMGQEKYQRDGDPKTSGPGFGIAEHSDALDAPLKWRKPRRVFVNSMSDLFHDGVSAAFIAEVWSVMARTPQHTYQVLTKRHGRMKSLLNRPSFRDNLAHLAPWPLPNVWLGVSVEDQKRADLRVVPLLQTPAAVRFLSCEPLLGPVDLGNCAGVSAARQDWTGGPTAGTGCPHPLVDWVIVGGESGPGSRPMNADWARKLRDECDAGAPWTDRPAFFFKQWGESAPLDQLPDDAVAGWEIRNGPGYPSETQCRVGKHAAGRELDGRTWDEYPGALTTEAAS